MCLRLAGQRPSGPRTLCVQEEEVGLVGRVPEEKSFSGHRGQRRGWAQWGLRAQGPGQDHVAVGLASGRF